MLGSSAGLNWLVCSLEVPSALSWVGQKMALCSSTAPLWLLASIGVGLTKDRASIKYHLVARCACSSLLRHALAPLPFRVHLSRLEANIRHPAFKLAFESYMSETGHQGYEVSHISLMSITLTHVYIASPSMGSRLSVRPLNPLHFSARRHTRSPGESALG